MLTKNPKAQSLQIEPFIILQFESEEIPAKHCPSVDIPYPGKQAVQAPLDWLYYLHKGLAALHFPLEFT